MKLSRWLKFCLPLIAVGLLPQELLGVATNTFKSDLAAYCNKVEGLIQSNAIPEESDVLVAFDTNDLSQRKKRVFSRLHTELLQAIHDYAVIKVRIDTINSKLLNTKPSAYQVPSLSAFEQDLRKILADTAFKVPFNSKSDSGLVSEVLEGLDHDKHMEYLKVVNENILRLNNEVIAVNSLVKNELEKHNSLWITLYGDHLSSLDAKRAEIYERLNEIRREFKLYSQAN
jgi:hypothetical protein